MFGTELIIPFIARIMMIVLLNEIHQAPELKQVNMMKRLANHIAENKHLAPRERFALLVRFGSRFEVFISLFCHFRDEVDEEIDYIPDGVNMLYDTYQMFKLPGRSDSVSLHNSR